MAGFAFAWGKANGVRDASLPAILRVAGRIAFIFLAIDNKSFLSDHSFAMKHAHFGLAMLLLVAAALAWMIPGGQTSEVSENFGGASARSTVGQELTICTFSIVAYDPEQ